VLGVTSLALGKGRPSYTSVAAALATSLIIAAYTVTDGIGARLSGNTNAYVAWIFLLYGILMPATFLLVRRKLIVSWSDPETPKALAAGLVQLVTYGVVIWAFTLSPIGPISALRETSVVFAAVIGRLFLGETLTIHRLGSCMVIAVGAVLLASGV
jgi:drug/metabolite transporter (DMT)-like permease